MAWQGDEETEMLSIRVDKRPISQSAVVGFALVVATQAFIAGGLYYKFTTLATDAASKADFAALTSKVEGQGTTNLAQAASVNSNIDDIQKQLRPLALIEQRMDQNDKRDDAQDARMDRFTETVTNTMELIRKDVNGIGTKIEVLSSKLDNISPEKKAGLTTPPELVR